MTHSPCGRLLSVLIAGALALSACTSSTAPKPRAEAPEDRDTIYRDEPAPVPLVLPPAGGGQVRAAPFSGQGSGQLIGRPPGQPQRGIVESPNGISLNFVNADVRDVARSVLGEMLGLTYTIDPQAQGQVTIETSRPIARASVLPALESAFRSAGVGLVDVNGIWHVVPLANAARYATVGHRGSPGFTTEIVPLHWVTADTLQRALEPLLPPGATVRADAPQNVLIVSGAGQDVAEILDNIAVFDVDALRGASFAFIPLRNGQARAIAAELPKVLGLEGGPAAGMIRAVPIERLNAVLVTSLQQGYVDRARRWIERLDIGSTTADRRIYVYRVQNGRAADIAMVLSKVLGTAGSASPSRETPSPLPDTGAAPQPAPEMPPPQPQGLPAASPAPQTPVPDVLAGGLGGGAMAASPAAGSQLRITADEVNNALLVLANPQEWATVQSALMQLDIPSLQVLIEASIAEVTLTGALNYGVQYYVNSGRFGFNQVENATGVLASTFPGLNLLYNGGANTNVIISALEQLTTVKVLSSPDLLVLNNQKARLQVGDQVPIATQSAVGTLSPGAPIVNSIEYRDTGVILQITPRVNGNGLVSLDISQEVSAVSPTTSSTLDSPTIQQRRIASSVSVQDGQTIALGGLIQDNRTVGKSGIPILMDIPYLGALFGVRTVSNKRTELIVLITPHVVRDRNSARAVTEELRGKLPLLTGPLPTKVR
jgi:general secretion pathway protein D